MGIKVYKLVRQRKDGSLGPLFINARLRIPMNTWMEAEEHPTKGFAYRPGWHCCFKPVAPHLSEKNRVWVECEAQDYCTYARPESQGGCWILAKRIKVLRILSKNEVQTMQKTYNIIERN
jgi:hypothetical protein